MPCRVLGFFWGGTHTTGGFGILGGFGAGRAAGQASAARFAAGQGLRGWEGGVRGAIWGWGGEIGDGGGVKLRMGGDTSPC